MIIAFKKKKKKEREKGIKIGSGRNKLWRICVRGEGDEENAMGWGIKNEKDKRE